MKIPTPRQVVAAYRKTGLRPTTGHAVAAGDGVCCALGALVYAKRGLGVEQAMTEPYLYTAEAIHELGLPRVIGDNFASGFDSGMLGTEDGESVQDIRRTKSFQAGVAAAKSCKRVFGD